MVWYGITGTLILEKKLRFEQYFILIDARMVIIGIRKLNFWEIAT